MVKKCNLKLVFFPLLMCFFLSQLAFGQTVDPCQYGCPKSGCPQCPEGGPIETKAAPEKTATDKKSLDSSEVKTAAFNVDKCISSCDMQYDSCIKKGNTNEYCGGQLDACHNSCLEHK